VPDRYRTPRPPRGNAPTRIACVMTRRRLWRRHLPWASHAMRCVVTTCCVALLFALPIEWRLYMLADPPSAGLACCPVAVVALGMVLGGLACVRASSATEQNVSLASRHYAGGDTKSVVPDTKAAVTVQETATAISVKQQQRQQTRQLAAGPMMVQSYCGTAALCRPRSTAGHRFTDAAGFTAAPIVFS
jgi:hypothetical protein